MTALLRMQSTENRWFTCKKVNTEQSRAKEEMDEKEAV